MKSVAEAAQSNLGPRQRATSLAQVNTFTDQASVDSERRATRTEADACRHLLKEPLVAWVRVEDVDTGDQQVLLVARNATVSGKWGRTPSGHPIEMTHRGAPMGRLASLEPEDGISIGHRNWVVLEKCLATPVLGEHWDGMDASLFFDGDVLDRPSLLAFLQQVGIPADEDPWATFLEESEPVVSRPRFVVALRDVAILDQWQDKVFRRPLEDRALLLGPPGTGKTTTLIKRIAHHRLTAEEREEAETRDDAVYTLGGRIDPHEWQLFSPTPLLRDYAKEAFSKENVPAGNEHVLVWEAYRGRIASETLNLLKRAGQKSGFILEKRARPYPSVSDQMSALAGFQEADLNLFRARIRTAIERVTAADPDELKETLKRLSGAVEDDEPRLLLALADAAPTMRRFRVELRDELMDMVERRLGRLARADSGLLRRLASTLNDLKDVSDEDSDEDDTDIEDSRDEDAEEQAERPTSLTEARKAKIVRAVVRALAARAQGRMARNTQARAILDGLPTSAFTAEEIAWIGRREAAMRGAAPLVSPVRERFRGIPRRYRRYRGQARAELFGGAAGEKDTLRAPELDLLVTVALRAAGTHLTNDRVLGRLGDDAWSVLGTIATLMRNQIVIDEVTDFAPLQLAAMHALSNPRIGGLLAAGDFAQRLTHEGLRNIAAARAVIPGLEEERIEIGYRQSRELTRFTHDLLRSMGQKPPNTKEARTTPTDVPPALLTGGTDDEWADREAAWIAIRIGEIDIACGKQLPSVAVFVPKTEDIKPMAMRLEEAFDATNFKAQACEGEMLGDASCIRVFAIERIKGLEFEAAIIARLDELEQWDSDLARQYLYVGASRPATFLGITCQHLPKVLESVRSSCVDEWSERI